MSDKASEKNKLSKKGGRVFIGVSFVVIIILLIIIVVLLFQRKEVDEPKRNIVVNQKNAEEIVSEMISQEYIAPGYYSASMNTTWHFETGDAISEDAYVANGNENTNDVYFDIYLEGDEDTAIFQSPVIPRGSELENIKLDKVLEAGTYPCVLIYHLIDEEQNTISTLRVGLTIIVEE